MHRNDLAVSYSHRITVASRGFTFVELIIVMAIVGIVTTVSAPAVTIVYLDAQVKTAARDFAADLRLARAEAVATGAAVQIIPESQRGWTDGWSVRSKDRLISGRPATINIEARASMSTALTYSKFGALVEDSGYSVLFHAPAYLAVTPRCVYVRADGRPIVETESSPTSCGRS